MSDAATLRVRPLLTMLSYNIPLRHPGSIRGSPVDSTCDRALVCEHTRYSPFVLGGGTSDESRVVNYTILGSVALGLECPEESLGGNDINAVQQEVLNYTSNHPPAPKKNLKMDQRPVGRLVVKH